jgi:hypothetical protein
VILKANRDGWFGKSDPFLAISRIQEDGSWIKVHTTEKIDNNLSPSWATFRMPLQKLCNGDLDRPLKFEIFDWDSNGKHETMGAVESSLRSLIDAGSTPHPVIEAAKKKDSKYVNSGTLVTAVSIEHHPTFTQFVKGGTELDLVVAIDFTASNGDPAQASSLHYIDPSGAQVNDYQRAIRSVGSIIEAYDTDKKFPVFGFGGKVDGTINHAFQIGASDHDGVSGVEAAYVESLKTVALSGPTLLAPILGKVRGMLASNPITQERQRYTVLLVICDGSLNDMDSTIHELVELSGFPISVIILGVGGADFEDMHKLDADGKRLESGGKVASRDVVQFVALNEFSTKSGKWTTGAVTFSEAVLAEVPTQFLQFMEQRGLVPNPPPPSHTL